METATPTTTVAAGTPAESPMARSGAGVAALLSAGIGVFVMAIVNLETEVSPGFLNWVWGAGQVWVPDAQAIGPYSGLETFLLLAWLASWIVLYVLFRKRENVNTRLWVSIAVALVLLAVLLIWPPVVDVLKTW